MAKKKPANKDLVVQGKYLPAMILDPTSQPKDYGVEVPEFLRDKFEKVAPTGLTPIASFGEPEPIPGTYFLGRYLGEREDIGPNDSMLYDFETVREPGQPLVAVSVWGSTILDTKFRALRPQAGQWVFIQFLGVTDSKKKGNPAKDFAVAIVPEKVVQQYIDAL